MSKLRLALSLALLVAAQPARAQSGTLAGTVTLGDSQPLPFALLRLTRTGSDSAARERVSDAAGKFWFGRLDAGDYRLQLLRVGYRPVLSDVVHVAAGATARLDFRASSSPVLLAGMNVRATPACLTASQLCAEPQLLALWNEARRGLATRRAFELTYRFTRELRQDVTLEWRLRRNSLRVRIDTATNEPDSVLVRDARYQAAHRQRGYGEGMTLVLPNEKELLDDAFLAEHCLVTTIESANGLYGLRFRPVREHDDMLDIRGVLWVDAASFQTRRLDLEYVRGRQSRGVSTIEYGDVVVDGAALRLPVSGVATVRAHGANRTLVSGARARLTYGYRGFVAQR